MYLACFTVLLLMRSGAASLGMVSNIHPAYDSILVGHVRPRQDQHNHVDAAGQVGVDKEGLAQHLRLLQVAGRRQRRHHGIASSLPPVYDIRQNALPFPVVPHAPAVPRDVPPAVVDALGPGHEIKSADEPQNDDGQEQQIEAMHCPAKSDIYCRSRYSC